VQQFYGLQAQKCFQRGKSHGSISSWRSMKLRTTAGFYLLEQDHIFGGSGGFGAFASTFNSNPFSVPSE